MKQATGPPSVADFSQESVRKAVRSRTLQHPLTLYPLVLSALGGLTLFLFDPMVIAFLAAMGGLTLGVGTFVVNYFFRGDNLAHKYLELLQNALREHTKLMIVHLEEDLQELGCERGFRQFGSFSKKFENFKGILDDKLDSGEITYRRYLGIAEQVYFSGLDNLSQAAVILRSMRTIDEVAIESRINEIKTDDIPDDKQKREYEALVGRKNLLVEQGNKIEELLSQNEEALTTLDQTSGALAGIQTKRGYATVDMETAMKELQQMAERAYIYSSS